MDRRTFLASALGLIMPASPESYAIASGAVLAAGRYAARPVLGAIGHSKVNYETGTYDGIIQSPYAHHKLMNALLRKPFDYVRCNIPAATMGTTYATALNNGFYGRPGQTAETILGGTPAGVATYIDQMEELIGNRRALICLNAESNTLYGGISAASGHACWDTVDSMRALIAAKGWKVAVSEPTPSTSYNSAGNNAAAVAYRDDCIAAAAAGEVINLTGMLNSFHDPADASGYLRPLSGYTLDGAHLDFEGALKLACAFADAFPTGLYAPWKPRSTDIVCSQNPTLETSGGTVGTNASGFVPAGFTLNWYGSNVSAVGTHTDDGYELELSYTGSNYTSSEICNLTASSYIANVVAGESVLEGLCDIEILECSNFGVQMTVSTGVSSGSVPPSSEAFIANSIPWRDWLHGRRMVLHTDVFRAPSGITRATASFSARPITNANTAYLRARIRWLGVKHAG